MVLPALEEALREWLRAELPLPVQEGDVSFEVPDGTWGAGVSRPTVNVYLVEVAPAAAPYSALPAHRDPQGKLVQGPPAPPVAFTYLVSAWGGGVTEEHRLLSDVLRAFLGTAVLPECHGRPGLAGPVRLGLADPASVRVRDLWGAFGGRPRPGLVVVATTVVPVGRPQPVAAQVTDVSARVQRGIAPPDEPPSEPDAGPTAGPAATPDAEPAAGPAAEPTAEPDPGPVPAQVVRPRRTFRRVRDRVWSSGEQ